MGNPYTSPIARGYLWVISSPRIPTELPINTISTTSHHRWTFQPTISHQKLPFQPAYSSSLPTTSESAIRRDPTTKATCQVSEENKKHFHGGNEEKTRQLTKCRKSMPICKVHENWGVKKTSGQIIIFHQPGFS